MVDSAQNRKDALSRDHYRTKQGELSDKSRSSEGNGQTDLNVRQLSNFKQEKRKNESNKERR